MPDETTPPAPQPAPQQPAEVNGLWAVGWKLLGLSAEQQRGLVALALTAFLMWFVYDAVQEGRRAENERTSLVIRAFEGEGEKGRRAIADHTQASAAALQSVAVALGKLESQLATQNTTVQELQREVKYLGSMIGELKKKLPPLEIHAAPAPRAKVTGA